MIPTTMRAAVITRFGGPDVLEVQERPVPTPSASEILVRVHTSALNRADIHQREGNYPAPKGAPADIPGLEFAGEVAALGAGVTNCTVGDRVFGIVPGGGNAQYLTTDARAVAPIPESLDWESAAAVPEAFMTAHDALITQAGVLPNEYVLIHAVGSGVGLAATQLARAWKAVPIGTARGADKIERAQEHGLMHGIVVGDDVDAIAPQIERITQKHGVDITLDLLGGAYVGASIRASALRARIMLIGTVAGRTSSIPTGVVLGKRLTIRGTVLRARSMEEKRVVTDAFTRDVLPRFASGELQPTVDSIFALDQIGDAHERMASNRSCGKIVLRID